MHGPNILFEPATDEPEEYAQRGLTYRVHNDCLKRLCLKHLRSAVEEVKRRGLSGVEILRKLTTDYDPT